MRFILVEILYIRYFYWVNVGGIFELRFDFDFRGCKVWWGNGCWNNRWNIIWWFFRFWGVLVWRNGFLIGSSEIYGDVYVYFWRMKRYLKVWGKKGCFRRYSIGKGIKGLKDRYCLVFLIRKRFLSNLFF